MAKRVRTPTLLTELEAIDLREDHILDTLLRRGERLERLAEEAEKERRLVRAEELRALKEGLAALQVVAGEVQQRIAHAEAEAEPPGDGAPPAGFDELAAQIRQHGAESDRLRALLRDRLGELKAGDNGHHNVEDDHDPPVVKDEPRTFRLTSPPMTGRDVKAFQRVLNERYATWRIDKRVREDGRYEAKTKRAAHQVAYGLGIEGKDDVGPLTPGLRALIRNPSRRTAEQLDRARRRRPWLRKLRERHAGTTPGVAEGPPAHGLAAAIHAHGGRYGRIIVSEARRSGVPVALVCAVIEKETHFTNVFGHDAVDNPVKSPPRPAPDLEVTEARYRKYLKHRKLGQGNQGVGPMQLTNPGLQDRADELGGCWRPDPNIRVGVEFLADNIERLGRKAGIQAYNGASGDAYATAVLALEERWRARLRERPADGGVPARARTFRLANPQMRGRDVKAFQRVLNKRFAAWKIDKRIDVDGRYGTETKRAARQAAYGLGITDANELGPVTPALRALIRTPSRRTAQQVERARRRRPWLRKLRRQIEESAATAGSRPPAARAGSSNRPPCSLPRSVGRASSSARRTGRATSWRAARRPTTPRTTTASRRATSACAGATSSPGRRRGGSTRRWSRSAARSAGPATGTGGAARSRTPTRSCGRATASRSSGARRSGVATWGTSTSARRSCRRKAGAGSGDGAGALRRANVRRQSGLWRLSGWRGNPSSGIGSHGAAYATN